MCEISYILRVTHTLTAALYDQFVLLLNLQMNVGQNPFIFSLGFNLEGNETKNELNLFVCSFHDFHNAKRQFQVNVRLS